MLELPSANRLLSPFVLATLVLCADPSAARADVFFYYDAEADAVGAPLPNPDSGGGPNFWPFGDEANRGRVASEGGAPQGAHYFQFTPADGQGDAINNARDRDTFDVTGLAGRTFYLAHYERFDRVDGRDIWHDTVAGDSADKGVEIDGTGVRWIVGRGQWGSYAANADHRFSVQLGNPAHHLNRDNPRCPVIEVADNIPQNASGYSLQNPIQLEYERWYEIVLEIKMNTFDGADPNPDGAARVWVDGELVFDYSNICTLAQPDGTISEILLGGTIAQPAYDAPAHLRKFDALLLTDDFDELAAHGFGSGSTPSTDAGVPTPPDGGPITDASTSTDDAGEPMDDAGAATDGSGPPPDGGSDQSGCGCSSPGSSHFTPWLGLLWCMGALFWWRQRRRRAR